MASAFSYTFQICWKLKMELVHFLAVIISFYDTVDLLCGGHDIGQRSVMIHKVDQGSNKFAHVSFHEIRSVVNFRRQIGKVCGNDLIEITMFVSSIEILQAVGEQTKGTADVDASRMHGL